MQTSEVLLVAQTARYAGLDRRSPFRLRIRDPDRPLVRETVHETARSVFTTVRCYMHDLRARFTLPNLSSSALEPTSELKLKMTEIRKRVTEEAAEMTSKRLLKQLESMEGTEAEERLAGIERMFRIYFVSLKGDIETALDMLDRYTGTIAPEDREDIRDGLRRMILLCEELLKDRKSMEAGVDVLPLIEENLGFLRSLKIPVSVSDNHVGATITGNPVQLSRLFMNLIRNAGEVLDGREGAKVKISVSVGTDRLRVSVQDNGPGIPADLLPKIMRPGVSTKPENPLIDIRGMGLAIVAKVIEQHGGTLEVESKVGVGTTFHASFPLAL